VIYEEYAPSLALQPFVDRLWALEAPAGAADADPVLPDGHVEIIVHAGDPFFEIVADGTRRRQASVLLAGQLTRAVQLAPSGATLVAGARLHPNGAHAFFGLRQNLVTDRVVDLTDVDAGVARILRDDLTGRDHRRQLATALDGALCRLAPPPAPVSPVQHVLRLAQRRRGLIQVSDLARAAGVSDRQVQRAFRDEVGISPKRWLRVLRFQEVLRRVRGQSHDVRWTEVAAACGFYDQAHFVHDFRSFTDQAPGAWAIEESSLTAVFSAWRRNATV
jgi:AraC-like DNA-binding protein